MHVVKAGEPYFLLILLGFVETMVLENTRKNIEYTTRNAQVEGSNPSISSRNIKASGV
ncbi:hypothetical protein MHLNE_09070 [Moorella humiferrea]